MTKRKLLIKDKEEILKIIAKFLYNKEIKSLYDELVKKQTQFDEDIRKWYYKEFNITKDLLDFANKYNIIYECYACNVDEKRLNKIYPLKIFNYTNSYMDNFINNYWTACYNLKLPYYNKLDYITISTGNSTSNEINNKYIEIVENICIQINDKSEEILKIYKDIKNIIQSSDYVEDFENIIKIQEVTDFINQRFINKKSTAICALNKEKIDFVKNYLTSIK